MKHHMIPASVALACSLVNPAFSDQPKTEGRLTAELTFASIDTTGKGYVHQGDMEQYRSDVFISMDYDDSGRISYDEFRAWDPGFSYIAETEGKEDAYTTATKIVFTFWDRNNDGEMTEAEMRFSIMADFRRADLNDDAILSEDEFLNSFGIIVAMRAALRPDL